jgi:16S rRNA (guanine527-N7)-methyltransferase
VTDLASRLESSGLHLPSEAVSRLDRYIELLRIWGEKTSLVGPEVLRDPVGLVIESLDPIRNLPAPARLLDVGSGGGIPAIPLAIAWPVGWIELVEPRRKRWSFLTLALRNLTIPGRAEEARVESVRRIDPVDVLTMRGVPTPGDWLARLQPLVCPRGLALVWSGVDRRAEIAGATGWKLEQERALPGGHRLFLLRAFPVEHAGSTAPPVCDNPQLPKEPDSE